MSIKMAGLRRNIARNNSNNSKNSNISNNNNSNDDDNNNNSNKKFTVMATGLTVHASMRLLLLTACCHLLAGQSVAAVAMRNETVSSDEFDNVDHCVVVLQDAAVQKQIGAVWVSSLDPCAIHACEADDRGRPKVTITVEDCGQFYCDVDSELRARTGTCCGACVRTKCRFNDTIYDIGQTWHNRHDCTLLECTQLANGQPIINAYQKSCAALPPDCAPNNIYVADCCHFCRSDRNGGSDAGTAREAVDVASMDEHQPGEDIWTEDYYRRHPCVRECLADGQPQTCHYRFVVEWYETLSKACYDCPHNVSDCGRPHCIVADGMPRSVTVVNRMMPGPALEVCVNDIVVVDVHNRLMGESTTIHWHGLHQLETPYMDGVPHISQCPISPHATFRYRFRADQVGTHFWHSHTGMQRGDGVFGALIIRQPRTRDPHAHLYDFDLSEHTMLVQDWAHVPGLSMFASHHHSRGDNKPLNLLINGHGRYYKAIWEATKRELESEAHQRSATDTPPVTDEQVEVHAETTEPVNDWTTEPQADEVIGLADAQQQPLGVTEQVPIRLQVQSGKSQPLQEAGPKNLSTTAANFGNISQRYQHSRTTGERPKRSAYYNIDLDRIPVQVYRVQSGSRYRFRIINAEFLNCPIAISVDNHTLTAINSDGYDFEAVDVGSIVTYAGERFDFVLHANQPTANYWVRLKGLMDCSELFTSAFQVAVLSYVGAEADGEPHGSVGYHHTAPGIELNAMNRGSGHVDSLTIAELTALPSYDAVPGIDRDALKPVADYKFFVYYDFYAKDNPSFHLADYYGFNASLSGNGSNNLFTPQLNHISLKLPSLALLPSRDELDESLFCNETSLLAQGVDCRREFCKCHHVLQVPLNAIVELIIVDEGFTYDANHPFHLHGNAFRVVGLERLGTNVTIEMVKQLDRYNLLKRNLLRPPIKDTVTIPDGGYTIVRFEAYNPGFWLFHCHIEFHAEIGMALVLKVGDNDQMMPVPKGFPTCHDYMPDPDSDGGGAAQPDRPTTEATIVPTTGGVDSGWRASHLLLLTAFWSHTLISKYSKTLNERFN